MPGTRQIEAKTMDIDQNQTIDRTGSEEPLTWCMTPKG